MNNFFYVFQAFAQVLKCPAYEGIPLSGRHLESLRQLRVNRDQPENIDHELWRDNDNQLPVLNFFTVSAVNDSKVTSFSYLKKIRSKMESYFRTKMG